MHRFRFYLCGVVLALSGCTYGPKEVHSHITNIIRPPGTRTVAVMVARQELQAPTGISQFPDGGVARILSQEAIIYLCDMEKPSVKQLAIYREDGQHKLSFEPWLLGLKEGKIYFQASGCAPNSRNECWGQMRTTQQFEISIADGAVSRIDKLPETIVRDANSPLAPNPGEQNYMRYSQGYHDIKITTTDSNGFQPALNLRDDGTLEFDPKFGS